MDQSSLNSSSVSARAVMADEAARTTSGFYSCQDPAFQRMPNLGMGLDTLKRKFEFLAEYSDEFINATGVDVLIKAETASRKLQKFDKERKAEDKLFSNRENITATPTMVPSGSDNRLDILHPARFLPGATCSAAKMWLEARKLISGTGPQPLSTYDMASIGLGGSVSAKGWVEIHNPASPFLTIKMFSMNNCVAKSRAADTQFPELEDLSEFKAALRVLRGAMAFVHPWNRSVDALENFFIQNNFCSSDLTGNDRQALLLSQFTDYILVENASRWRGMEPFLDTRSLRNTWADFSSQKNLSAKPKQQYQNQSKPKYQQLQIQSNNQSHQPQYQSNNSTSFILPSVRHNMPAQLFKDDICVLWNLGKCLRSPGTCTTKNGRTLRHCCNHRPDASKPELPCGKDHMAKLFH